MNNRKNSSFFSGSFAKLAVRFTLLFALIIPLVDALLLSPLCDTVLANIGEGILYEMVGKISELVVTTAFLAECAVIVCCVFAGQNKLAAKLFWIEGLSFLFLVVMLKPAVLWVNAAIDEYLLSEIGTFMLSNYTLSQIHDELLLWWAMISYFMNVLMLTVVMCASFFAAKLKVSSIKATGRKLSHETLVAGLPKNSLLNPSVAVPTVVYLITQLIFCITDTVDSITNYGAPVLVSEYLFLILPFVYKIGFAIVGYFVCQYIAYAMISSLGKKA
ncbi:MAG: hypothetical protein J6M35_07310 [Clostridia bacterium]|nr:hypothetical protein [Clostridia bacterium]